MIFLLRIPWKLGTLLYHWTHLLSSSVKPNSDYGIVAVDNNIFKAQVLIVRSSHDIKEDEPYEIGTVWSHDQKDAPQGVTREMEKESL